MPNLREFLRQDNRISKNPVHPVIPSKKYVQNPQQIAPTVVQRWNYPISSAKRYRPIDRSFTSRESRPLLRSMPS